METLRYFIGKIKEYKNRQRGSIYSKAADSRTKEKVLSRLLATTGYVDFEIDYIVDESLIGGMVIRIGDRVVDSSIKTKLDEFAKDLKNPAGITCTLIERGCVGSMNLRPEEISSVIKEQIKDILRNSKYLTSVRLFR